MSLRMKTRDYLTRVYSGTDLKYLRDEIILGNPC